MKKLIYIAASLMVMLTAACDPMEDVYEELDALNPDNYKTDMAITLSGDDYALVEDTENVPAHVWEGNYFTSEKEAAEVIPIILDAKHPQLGNGTTALVTYSTVLFNYTDTGVTSHEVYEITEREDYQLGGAKYSNFDSRTQIETFLNEKFPAAEAEEAEGRQVTLTYTWYNSNANPREETVTETFYYINKQWVRMYLVTPEDYAFFGRNRYNNFVAADEEMLPAYLNKLLKENVIAKAGDTYYVGYTFYNGSNSYLATPLVYDGNNWTVVAEHITAPATMQFAKKNGEWVPDITIKYTLVAADYTWVANPANGLGNDAARTNLGSYGNFSTYAWSDEEIVGALSALLKRNFPDVEVGQKFVVSYDTYPGGLVEKTLILRDSGEYTEAQAGE